MPTVRSVSANRKACLRVENLFDKTYYYAIDNVFSEAPFCES